MAKQPDEVESPSEELDPLTKSTIDTQRFLDEAEQHYDASFTYMGLMRSGWDEKEAMLLGVPTDQLSGNTKSQVFDPRLSTIVFERAARVMYQPPRGDIEPVGEQDMGKSMLMSLLLTYFQKNANEQMPYLMKLRMLDLYSLVFGSAFALVPWRINKRRNFIGPEINLLNIRDCFPQPGIHQLEDADWFDVSTRHSTQWLEDRGASWDHDAISQLAAWAKEGNGQAAGRSNVANQQGSPQAQDYSKTSYTERTRFPSPMTSKGFPIVELVHEYRRDMWITFAPQIPDVKSSRPLILRVARDNPYVKKGLLPIVKKDAFPLIDSIIGLGEFERAKSLQFAINSLINLYLDGVKMSIFPPLHINFSEDVVMSTIKWGPAEKWLMKRPNEDVQAMANINPQGIQTFEGTYQFLLSALMSQAGTTEISTPNNVQPSVGRTPAALNFLSQRENSRDNWDSFQMDRTLEQINDRWICLINEKLPKDITTRLFPGEIANIKKKYPDVSALTEDGKPKLSKGITEGISKGRMVISPKDIKNEEGYDYIHEVNSTLKPVPEIQSSEVGSILNLVLQNPQLIKLMRAEGKDIKVSELFERLISFTSIKDSERIVTDFVAQPTMGNANAAVDPTTGQPVAPGETPPMAPPSPGISSSGGPMAAPMPPQGDPNAIIQHLMQLPPGQIQALAQSGQIPPDVAQKILAFQQQQSTAAQPKPPGGDPLPGNTPQEGPAGQYADPDIAQAHQMMMSKIPAKP
jgi:hypothetical protein